MKYGLFAARRLAGVLAIVATFLGIGTALAQMGPMGIPVNTTMVLYKPAPDELFGDKQLVTLAVGGKEYKFVLNDAYVDDRRIRWPDIWEQVRIYKPNFVMQGPESSQLETIKPGDTVTVKGMYAPLDRTFEIVFVQAGKGVYEPKKEY